MNTVLLIVPVDVEYPASLSTVDWIEAVGFILRLKTQVFSSNLYNPRFFFQNRRAKKFASQIAVCVFENTWWGEAIRPDMPVVVIDTYHPYLATP